MLGITRALKAVLAKFLASKYLRYNIYKRITKVFVMPISLRLPADLETQIAGFSARLGLSKSAVIVRSIQEFLAKHAQPSSLQIYEEAMRGTLDAPGPAKSDENSGAAEQRPHKLQARAAIRRKHAQRSERAVQAQPKPRRSAGKSA